MEWQPIETTPYVVDSKISEQIEETLSLIRHNKVYEELEEVDVEAYNMAESLIETLVSKLEATEKSRDEWRSMWEKEQDDNEELQSENKDLKSDLNNLSYSAELQLSALEQYMQNMGAEDSARYAEASFLADIALRKAIEYTKGELQ